ncbi:nitrous oxide reductase accessory protein NosL [Natrialbaceae archaeon A-gly3]
MTPEERTVDRRWVLGTIGIGATAALAGCLGDDDEPEQGGDTDDDDDEPALSEPADFPEDDDESECAVCSMITVDNPEWNAQLVHEDGHREFFCSSGCMAAYYADPEHFGGPDSEIENVWVTEYGADVDEDAGGDVDAHGLIDGADAYFARVIDRDDVDGDAMGVNPIPFAQRAGAEAFLEDFEAYDDADVITLEDFDMDLAMTYRAQFFEDDGDGDGHDH